MSKQISPEELGKLVLDLLVSPELAGEDLTEEAYGQFIQAIADVVCDFCGGQTDGPASPIATERGDEWYVGVWGNDSLPGDGGVWARFDPEGELFEEKCVRSTEAGGSMSQRKFFKQVIQITVYSEDVPLEWDDLYDVSYAIDQGDCVGKVEELSWEPLTGKQVADGLIDAGSTPDFFELDADGNDLEEEE